MQHFFSLTSASNSNVKCKHWIAMIEVLGQRTTRVCRLDLLNDNVLRRLLNARYGLRLSTLLVRYCISRKLFIENYLLFQNYFCFIYLLFMYLLLHSNNSICLEMYFSETVKSIYLETIFSKKYHSIYVAKMYPQKYSICLDTYFFKIIIPFILKLISPKTIIPFLLVTKFADLAPV